MDDSRDFQSHFNLPRPGSWRAVGLMSGTSRDGLDIVDARFTRDVSGLWSYEILLSATVPFSSEVDAAIDAVLSGESPEAWPAAEALFSSWCGEQVTREVSNVAAVDVVGFHGQTLFHRPLEGWTGQLASGAALHARLNGVPVVCDFRSLDVALGGQGAPLVPLVDRLLFGKFPRCLNLGGFANLSVQANASAWDVGPCNLLLNYLAARSGRVYDDGGRIARTGTVDPDLLDCLLALPYHAVPPPKSLGTEWLNSEVLPLVNEALAAGLSEQDAMRTATAYIVAILLPSLQDLTLVTGGGAHNTFLIEELESAGASLVLPGDELINGKEALAFGLLALLRFLGEPNVLRGTTGASVASVGGALWGVSSRRDTSPTTP